MKSPFRTAGWLLIAASCFATVAGATSAADTPLKPRVIATTDGEVDDRSSMIRFLLYACDFDVAGIVEVNSKFQKNGHSKELWIQEQLDAYEQVLPNLRKHNANYPPSLVGYQRVLCNIKGRLAKSRGN